MHSALSDGAAEADEEALPDGAADDEPDGETEPDAAADCEALPDAEPDAALDAPDDAAAEAGVPTDDVPAGDCVAPALHAPARTSAVTARAASRLIEGTSGRRVTGA